VYNDYSSWDNLPSFSEKSAVNNDPRLLLEKAFNTQQYEDVISLSDSILSNTQTLEPNVLLYQGIAQLELDRFEDAIQTFPNLSKSNALDAHKGYWYIALVYAKQGDQQAFVAALKKVESDPSNFNYPQAVQLLKEFE
jgi:tetratricopeptide (TPR) repeat protein